jgi:hypothetical protein
MYRKIILPMLIGILVISITQFVFAEEFEKTTFIGVNKEQFEQPQSKYDYQEITITGYIENYIRGEMVIVKIIHPDGSQDELQTHATKKGEIYTLFQIKDDSQVGVHTVILKYNDVERTTTSFEILEKQ